MRIVVGRIYCVLKDGPERAHVACSLRPSGCLRPARSSAPWHERVRKSERKGEGASLKQDQGSSVPAHLVI